MSSIRPNSSVKPRSSRTISRTKAVDETERKKIYAIVNYDKDKIATLPELKIRISKEKTQKLNGDKPSMNSEGVLLKKSETGISSTDDGDENPIIDKTVAMLECEKKPSALDINDEKSRGKTEIAKRQDDKDKAMEKTKTVSSCVAVLPLASSLRTNM
ncbi:COP1-interacting-like protein, partial [Trifolium medium]|nr:COP1-interacting-like protein [Trifolium medium]